MTDEFTARHCRAARLLLGLQQSDLAVMAGVGVNSVSRFESETDKSKSRPAIVQAIRRALEDDGAVFLSAGSVCEGRKVKIGVAVEDRGS